MNAKNIHYIANPNLSAILYEDHMLHKKIIERQNL